VADRASDVDSQGNPIIPNQQAVKAVGVDTEFEVVRNSLMSVIPYATSTGSREPETACTRAC